MGGAIPPELAAAAHPWLGRLLWAAAACYGGAFVAAAIRARVARLLLAAGVAVHLVATIGRGLAIEFFPLTNKMESFSAAALALGIVALVAFRPVRTYLLPLLAALGAALATALAFPGDLRWPPPLMRTIWYPLHVPLSFLAYAAWTAAAAAAIAWWARARRRTSGGPGSGAGEGADDDWLVLVDQLALWGLVLWSLAMVTGGVWGVVAWGAYFMWDPKVIWSVILWFHYAAFVHVKYTPSLVDRPGLRPALAAVGFLLVLVAYVGTSFLFRGSSHAFG
jgi:ABC-type transport system involved in cytochrome c biogenesis permease subunit